MPFDYVVVVPFIAPIDNLDGMLAGVEREHLPHFRFVDNSPGSVLREKNLEQYGAHVAYHPENLGVAASWNTALREGHEQTIICSASTRFPQGFGAVLRAFEYGCNRWGGLTRLGWHLLSLGRATVEKIGYLDENFWPAYYEDTDYACRMKWAGIHSGPGDDSSNLPLIGAPIARSGIAVSLKTGAYRVEFGQLGAYYQRKWGGVAPNETFRTPFNQGHPLDYWPAAITGELKARYGYAG